MFEYLSGRTVTSVNSAVRLLGIGYYDEALSISRRIAEIGNLAQLFFSENKHIRSWLDASDQIRKKNYSPASVRKSLEKIGSVIPTDQDTYTWLCEVGTHVTPKTRPQAHNSTGRPLLGAVLQPKGIEIALQSLAWSVCTVSGPTAKLAIIPEANSNALLEETIEHAKILFENPDGPLSGP